MSGTNVTYILGAGASCYSQPLVSDMKERMKCLIALLNPNSRFHKLNIDNVFKGKSGDLYLKYYPIVEKANKHFTPDTFAKKLSLTEQIDDLIILKEFLNLYFLFEQDYLYNAYKQFPEFKPVYSSELTLEEREKVIKKQKDIFFWDKIKTPIDYRYDVFLATLLENKGNTEIPKLLLPENYNIISWNYDNQWEFAYKEYATDLKLNEISRRLNINYGYDGRKSHILKVNGYCNCWDDENDQELTLYTAIEKLLRGENIKNTIEFAWEGSKPQYDVIHKIIEKTEIIVIIGYSFPNFNRDVDKTIFSNCKVGTTHEIIIQVPEKYEYEKIKQRIQTIKNITDSAFKHIPDADQFYIPL